MHVWGGYVSPVPSDMLPLEGNKTWIMSLFRFKNGVLSVNCLQIHFDKQPICFKWKMTLLQMSKRPWLSFRGLGFNKLKQADQTSRCVVYVWRSQQGWTGPWRSWYDRSGLRNKPSHVHWKEHIDPLPGSDLYLTFCEQNWANGWKLCKSPRAPNTHTCSSALSVCSGTCSTALGCKSGRTDVKIHPAWCFGYCLLPLFKCFGNTPPSHSELFHMGFLIVNKWKISQGWREEEYIQ